MYQKFESKFAFKTSQELLIKVGQCFAKKIDSIDSFIESK